LSFFVFGLPRSRTAWLSVFLSQSGIYCHHEGINGCKSMDEYKEKIAGCGDSTTAISFIDGHEDSPVVIIEKTDEEFKRCVDWCSDFTGKDMMASMVLERDRLYSVKGLRVMQSDIDNRLEEVFTHLTGCEFKSWYANLSLLNIQSNPANIDVESMRLLING